jgi:hypothetical protein
MTKGEGRGERGEGKIEEGGWKRWEDEREGRWKR